MDMIEKIKKLILENDCSVTIRTIAHHYQITISEARRALNQLAVEAEKDLEFYYTISGVKIQNKDMENDKEYKQSLIKQVKDTEEEEFVKLLKPGYIKTVYAVRKPNETPFKLSDCYQNLLIKGTQELNKLGYISIDRVKETKETDYEISQTSESIFIPKTQKNQDILKEANGVMNKDKENKAKETFYPSNNSTNTKPKVKKGQASITNFLAISAPKSSSKDAPKAKTKSKTEKIKTKESIEEDFNDKQGEGFKDEDKANIEDNIQEETIEIEAEDELNINNNDKNDENSKTLDIFTDEDEIDEHLEIEIVEEEEKLKSEEDQIKVFSPVKTKKKSKAQNKSKKVESKSLQTSSKSIKVINKKDKKSKESKIEEEDDFIVEKVAEYSDDDFIKHVPLKHRNSRIIDDDDDDEAQRHQRSKRNKNKSIKNEESEEELQSNASLVGSPPPSHKVDILDMLPAKKDKENKNEKVGGDKKRRRTNEMKSIMIPDGKGGFKVTYDFVYITDDEAPEKDQNIKNKNSSPQVDLAKPEEGKSKKPKPNAQSKGKQTMLLNFFKPKPK